MLGQAKLQDIAQRTLQVSEAPETGVVIQAEESYLTRFASNAIHQNVGESNVTVTIQAVDGKRTGTATTSDLSDEGLRKATEFALIHARAQSESPDFPGLPEPQAVESIAAVDDATASFSPEDRAKAVGTLCEMAKAESLEAFGAYTTGLSEIAVANSRGINVYHAITNANFQTVVRGDNGSGWGKLSSRQASGIDAESIAREAIEKAIRAQNPRDIEPGEYTVVVDPYVTMDILLQLNINGMSAQAVQEGRSWMNDRIGKQLMDARVSIFDDGRDLSGSPMPFDYEGLPRRKVSIVDKGVLTSPVYNYATALKEGKESTGHSTPPGARQFLGNAPIAGNLFMASGDSSVEEMIQSTERGLYITRFWYTRTVHPRNCVITGMTRDGVTMIENGELTFPVKNLRFTQSYLAALANVEAIGHDTKLLSAGYARITARVPALKIRNFNFTGITV